MNINILKKFKLIFLKKKLINIIFNHTCQLHLQNNFKICIPYFINFFLSF